MDQRNSGRELSTVARTQDQLGLLASFGNTALPSIIESVLGADDVDPSLNAVALASNQALDDLLSKTNAYLHCDNTPAGDFTLLSTGKTDDVVEAIGRLATGFLEARTSLANILFQAAQGAVAGERVDVDSQVKQSFTICNSAYVVVLTTVHALFEKPDLEAERLRPKFQELLKNDPFLRELSPHFASLHNAKNPDAQRGALRTFFETFCEQAVEPSLYDPNFSLVVQSILLRELTLVICEETNLDVEQRRLAPYLASLFDKRMRGELEVFQNYTDKPTPIVNSFRDCYGAANKLMLAVANLILESSDASSASIKLEDETIISCEVMLSIGCLLPEVGLIDFISKKLRQDSDLNPAIVLIFSSALKFAYHVQEEIPVGSILYPGDLVKLGVNIHDKLNDDDKERLISEVLFPNTVTFVDVMEDNDMEIWLSLDSGFRQECINKVILQKIIADEKTTNQSVNKLSDEKAISLLLAHLSPETDSVLEPAAIRWLVLKGVNGDLNPKQLGEVIALSIRNGDEVKALGLKEGEYESLLERGGIQTIDILSSLDGHEERLCSQLCSHTPVNDAEKEIMLQTFFFKLVTPLRDSLSEYAKLVKVREMADFARMANEEKGPVADNAKQELKAISKTVHELDEALCRKEGYLDILDKIAENRSDLPSLKATLAEVESLHPRELHKHEEYGSAGYKANLVEEIEGIERRVRELLSTKFKFSKEEVSGIPGFEAKSITIGELETLQRRKESLENQMQVLGEQEGGIETQDTRARTEIDSLRIKIHKLFSLVEKAMKSSALINIDPESLRLVSSDSFDLLGLFCKISLFVQSQSTGELACDENEQKELEVTALEALRQAFTTRGFKEDTHLVLATLAEIVSRGDKFLLNWEEGDSSLSEFLYKIFNRDLNDVLAWISADVGWDESMHKHLFTYFSSMLKDTNHRRMDMKTKVRSARMVFSGVNYWVKELEREVDRGTPQVDIIDLYRPWSRLLIFTAARVSDNMIEALKDNTEYLINNAIDVIPDADHKTIKEYFIPLYKALDACSKLESSSLYNSPLNNQSKFVAVLKKRIDELNEETRKRKEGIQESVPAPKDALGIDSVNLTKNGPLNLPAPRSSFKGLNFSGSRQVIEAKPIKPDEDEEQV